MSKKTFLLFYEQKFFCLFITNILDIFIDFFTMTKNNIEFFTSTLYEKYIKGHRKKYHVTTNYKETRFFFNSKKLPTVQHGLPIQQ